MHFSLDAKYLGSISCLQINACRLTPCILLCTFRLTQSTWGALAVYKVTHVGSLHVYCSTLLCTFRWTKSTRGALAGCSVTYITSHHVYCSTLLCTFHWTQSTWGALADYKLTHVGSLHVYCYALFVGRKVPGEH